MDVIRINSDTWLPETLVEGYNSFIWTERYLGAGEFELKTLKVDQLRALLPQKSKVGLRDAQEVMTVENHSIANTEDGPELTITGRTFETILEQRCTVVVNAGDPGGQNNMWTYGDDSVWPSDAAKALIMSHLTVSAQAPVQKVDGVAVENLVTGHAGEQMSYEHEPGELYPEIVRLLDMEDCGIRNQLDFEGNLKIYIYRGVDRTVHQSIREPVVFSLSAEHIVDPTYLFTIKDYRNVAYVVGEAWQQRVYAPGVSSTVTGEDRRILFVDGSQIKAESSEAKKSRQAKALGLAALAQHNQTLFFDAEVSPRSPYRRGAQYNLGDRVTLMAQYGVSQTMIISEFVRTEDRDGERSYPTLVTPSELENNT